MRSWKTPALLATIGLSGLGSLFAQVPVLPPAPEPTPASSAVEEVAPVPAAELPASGSTYSEVTAPTATESTVPVGGTPTYIPAPVHGEAPATSSSLQIQSVPSNSSSGPVTEVLAPAAAPAVISSSPVFSGPALPQAGCACNGSGSVVGGPAVGGPVMGANYGFNGHAIGANYGYGTPGPMGSIYTMGSHSGVASGVLTPLSNSGGLHTRYPYYNYRAPWYYQGPPSQNVTIIW